MKITKMKIIALLSLVFIIALNYSCTKDNEEEKYAEPINAGYTDGTYYSQILSSPINLIPVMDVPMLSLSFDSIIILDSPHGDINLHIRYVRVNNDSLMSITNSGIGLVVGFYMYGNDDLYFHHTRETYYIGHGASVGMSWVTPYDYGNVIRDDASEVNLWNNNSCKLWEMPIPNSYPPVGFKGGLWKGILGTHYVGFKYKGKLGWITITKSQNQYPKIISYAIKN